MLTKKSATQALHSHDAEIVDPIPASSFLRCRKGALPANPALVMLEMTKPIIKRLPFQKRADCTRDWGSGQS